MIDRWFAPVPARRLRIVRTLTFGYAAVWLLVRAGYVWDTAVLPVRRFEPVGVLAALDRPPERWLVMAVWAVATAGAVATALGRAVRVAAPAAALALLAVTTFTNSFGQIFHTEHLLALHLGVLAAAALVEPEPTTTHAGHDHASQDHASQDHADRDHAGQETAGWPLRLMMVLVVAAYVVAGIAKLRLGGSAWLDGDVLRGHVAYDNLRKVLVGDRHSRLGGWLAGVGWVWQPLAVASLAIELGAPLALIRGPVRWAWLGCVWVFHASILVLMSIVFPYQLTGIAFAAFLPLDRVPLDRLRPHRRPAAGTREAVTPGV